MLAPLLAADDRARFGGKAAQLARALAGGLPVPDGYALSWEGAAAVAAGRPPPALPPGSAWAVRSSAVDEDGAVASFAGQHRSLLNVPAEDLAAAVADVVASGSEAGALAYRERVGALAEARVAVVVQRMVQVRAAGVMFTRDPMTGAPGLHIEASWGLGEAVVQGLVCPDRWRLDRQGRLIEALVGDKDTEVVALPGGGTATAPVSADRALAACLEPAALGALVALAADLDRHFTGAHDVEFAVDTQGRLWLLQRREITR